MSDAVTVMESKSKGGALITAAFAIEHGRPLYAVPGPVTSERSAGCHALITSGAAQLLHTPDQVMPDGVSDGDRADLTATVMTADEAAEAWGCTVAEALVQLFEREMDGTVRVLPGGRYLVRAERDLSCTDVHPIPKTGPC